MKEEYQEAFRFRGPINLDTITPSLGRKQKTSVDAVGRGKEAPSAPPSKLLESGPPPGRKRKTSVDAVGRDNEAPSVLPSKHSEHNPSPPPRRMKRTNTSSSAEMTGREPSEELGNFDVYTSNLTPVTRTRKSRAMSSSSSDEPPFRGHTFSANPCPQPRYSPHPAGNHTGSVQSRARAVWPATEDPPISNSHEEDNGDNSGVIFVSSHWRKPNELKPRRGSGGYATSD